MTCLLYKIGKIRRVCNGCETTETNVSRYWLGVGFGKSLEELGDY